MLLYSLNFHHCHRYHHRLVLQTTFNFDWHETIIVVSDVCFLFLRCWEGKEMPYRARAMQVACAKLKCCLCGEKKVNPWRRAAWSNRAFNSLKLEEEDKLALSMRLGSTYGLWGERERDNTTGKQQVGRCGGVCVVDTTSNRQRAYKDTVVGICTRKLVHYASFNIRTPAWQFAFFPSFLFHFDLDVWLAKTDRLHLFSLVLDTIDETLLDHLWISDDEEKWQTLL